MNITASWRSEVSDLSKVCTRSCGVIDLGKYFRVIDYMFGTTCAPVDFCAFAQQFLPEKGEIILPRPRWPVAGPIRPCAPECSAEDFARVCPGTAGTSRYAQQQGPGQQHQGCPTGPGIRDKAKDPRAKLPDRSRDPRAQPARSEGQRATWLPVRSADPRALSPDRLALRLRSKLLNDWPLGPRSLLTVWPLGPRSSRLWPLGPRSLRLTGWPLGP